MLARPSRLVLSQGELENDVVRTVQTVSTSNVGTIFKLFNLNQRHFFGVWQKVVINKNDRCYFYTAFLLLYFPRIFHYDVLQIIQLLFS